MRPRQFLTALPSGITASILFMSFPQATGAQEAVLSINSTVSGRLESSDQQLAADGSYFDSYTFEGQAGQSVMITMTSEGLDSYLVLLDPNGNSLVQDDDSGGGLNAQIVYTLPVTGQYTVYANSYSPEQVGEYTLELQTVAASTPVATTAPLPRYFCDESGNNPVTRARRKDGVEGSLIEWTPNLALPDISTEERCRRVANNLDTIHTRLGRNFAITAGRLQNQPVVCAGTAPGVCEPDGLILTASDRDHARQLAIQLGTAITALRDAPSNVATLPSEPSPPNVQIPPSEPPVEDSTPLAIAPQFTFLDVLSYSNCLEDVIQLYQNPQQLKRSGRRSDCLADIFVRYPNGISRSQALEIIEAANRYATAPERYNILYPPRGQRVRIQELFGFTYAIDQ